MIKQYQNTSDDEIKDVSNVELSKISRMVIYSRGKTIRPDGMYPLMVTVIHNVGHAIIDMGQTNGHTLDGTFKNSDKKNSTNCEGGTKKLKNTKTSIWKNY